ncbi:MAG TPA: hypothetical protein VGQ81_01165 [Acidobacteriota bacterium]|nr:hypothetical protein [Acidobacteriota bacterium]
MKSSIYYFIQLLLAISLCLAIGCSRKSEKAKNTFKPLEISGGTLTANPNPIQVCDGSGNGVTTLTWTITKPTAKRVEVHVNSPDGPLLSHTLGPGSAKTGKWVADGAVFYLQDVTDKLPLVEDNTLAIVRVTLTTEGCR